jgi:hypothetical protein
MFNLTHLPKVQRSTFYNRLTHDPTLALRHPWHS